jgi:hypothetical protein
LKRERELTRELTRQFHRKSRKGSENGEGEERAPQSIAKGGTTGSTLTYMEEVLGSQTAVHGLQFAEQTDENVVIIQLQVVHRGVL